MVAVLAAAVLPGDLPGPVLRKYVRADPSASATSHAFLCGARTHPNYLPARLNRHFGFQEQSVTACSAIADKVPKGMVRVGPILVSKEKAQKLQRPGSKTRYFRYKLTPFRDAQKAISVEPSSDAEIDRPKAYFASMGWDEKRSILYGPDNPQEDTGKDKKIVVEVTASDDPTELLRQVYRTKQAQELLALLDKAVDVPAFGIRHLVASISALRLQNRTLSNEERQSLSNNTIIDRLGSRGTAMLRKEALDITVQQAALLLKCVTLYKDVMPQLTSFVEPLTGHILDQVSEMEPKDIAYVFAATAAFYNEVPDLLEKVLPLMMETKIMKGDEMTWSEGLLRRLYHRKAQPMRRDGLYHLRPLKNFWKDRPDRADIVNSVNKLIKEVPRLRGVLPVLHFGRYPEDMKKMDKR